jgi:hypothetical protein
MSLNNNIGILIFLFKHQNYFKSIINACNRAGTYLPENKLFYFTFGNLNNHHRYTLSQYQIIYSIRQMYLYKNKVQFYNDPIVKQYIQAYQGNYYNYLRNKHIYMEFRRAYEMAYFYSRLYNQIQNTLKYKNTGLNNDFIFTVPLKLFPHVNNNEITKKYSLNYIINLYQSVIEL